jgi:hypothetical protein
MIIRALDSTNKDWTFGVGKHNYFFDQNAIAQNIETRLLSFYRDCFFDRDAGVDWFRLLGTKTTEQEITLSCRRIILQSYGVVKINSLSVSYTGRRLFITYDIDTIFTSKYSQSVEVVSNA